MLFLFYYTLYYCNMWISIINSRSTRIILLYLNYPLHPLAHRSIRYRRYSTLILATAKHLPSTPTRAIAARPVASTHSGQPIVAQRHRTARLADGFVSSMGTDRWSAARSSVHRCADRCRTDSGGAAKRCADRPSAAVRDTRNYGRIWWAILAWWTT